MNRRLLIQIGIGTLGLGLLAWAVSSGIERLVAPPPQPPPATTPAAVQPQVPHITATMYYGTQDGRSLVALRREVPLGEGVRGQGRRIVETLLSKPPVPFVQVVPDGTTLRAFYLTPNGDAFVDLSGRAATAHPAIRSGIVRRRAARRRPRRRSGATRRAATYRARRARQPAL